MLRRFINECRFELRIEAVEPLLIKSGTSVLTGPDMAFVRTNRGGVLQPFIPGSSLKGVLRSHGERIARSMKDGLVCDVFDKARVEGCSTRQKMRLLIMSRRANRMQAITPCCVLPVSCLEACCGKAGI